MINLCIPSLNRYDKLVKCIESAEKGTLVPNRYLIMDNGGRLQTKLPKVEVVSYGGNIGVAASWNYFIMAAQETRIICNDDLEFEPNAIEELVTNQRKDWISYAEGASSFSCFVLNDSVVNKIGLFDEQISPHYAYYEDNDYSRRMSLVGLGLHEVSTCHVKHDKSSTMLAYSTVELYKHHMKFELAKSNYVKKWGGLPDHETFLIPWDGKKK